MKKLSSSQLKAISLWVIGLILALFIIPPFTIVVFGKASIILIILVIFDALLRVKNVKQLVIPRIIVDLSVAALIFFMVFSAFGSLRQAQWGPIDDHEIMLFLGDDLRVGVADFFPILSKTEVGDFGTSLRFRPSYYILRISEAMLLGPNPGLWYLSRLLIFCFGLFAFWKSFKLLYGTAVSILIVVSIYSQTYNIDLFTRLGPAESYGFLAFAMFCWSFIVTATNVYWNSKTRLISIITLSLSSLVLFGIKENFLIILLPLVGLLLFSLRKSSNKKIQFSLIFLIAIGLLTSLGIGFAMFKSGNDVYNNSVSLQSRLKTVMELINSWDRTVVILSSVLLTILGFITCFFSLIPKVYKFTLVAQLLLIWSGIILYISQFVFYGGAWPTNMRYDFPGLLAAVFIFPSLFYSIYLLAIALKSSKQILNGLRFGLLSYFALSIGVQVTLIRPHFLSASNRVVDSTTKFTERINHLAVRLNSDMKDNQVVIEAQSPAVYEQVYSLERFLRAYGVNNILYLRYKVGEAEKQTFSGLTSVLSDELEAEMTVGSEIFLPLVQVNPEKCVSINAVNSTSADLYCGQSI